MKRLHLHVRARINDPPVGQDAVHVQHQQLKAATALGEGGTHATRTAGSASSAGTRPIRSVMSNSPTGRPATSTTGNSLILRRLRISTASTRRVPSATVIGS